MNILPFEKPKVTCVRANIQVNSVSNWKCPSVNRKAEIMRENFDLKKPRFRDSSNKVHAHRRVCEQIARLMTGHTQKHYLKKTESLNQNLV